MSHTWKFFRTGGFDQVRIDTAADLLNLRELDQKLWVALSCPTTGIEFDARTLALIDSDGDGHIRAPELLGAIDWAAARLTDTAVFEQALAALPDIDVVVVTTKPCMNKSRNGTNRANVVRNRCKISQRDVKYGS